MSAIEGYDVLKGDTAKLMLDPKTGDVFCLT